MLATHLSVATLHVIAVNAVMAAWALVENVRACRRAPGDWRARFAVASVLAAVYVVGYISLFWWHDRGAWSEVMAGIGPVAWVAVWVWPARKSRRLWGRFQ